MKPVRLNTLVVDTSVFPKRPTPAEIKVFFDTKLHLDMTNVKRIQLHNIKNVVYLGMRDMAVAKRIADCHHLMHHMTIGGKEVPIPVPVYIETSATDVRLHDLPEEIDTDTIVQHMRQYGEVISISDELWKNFWPGFANGVTIVRMKLAHHIPSFVNFPDFDDSACFVTYPSQIKTCQRCNRTAHPKQRCSEAAATTAETAEKNPNSSDEFNTTKVGSQAKKNSKPAPQTATMTTTTTAAAVNEQSFPALPSTSTKTPEPKTTSSNKARVKRQHTIEEDLANKKLSGSDSRPLYEFSLDQQAIFDESIRNNECRNITDPVERKETLWYFAGRTVEKNKIKLDQQKQQQQQRPQ